MANPPALVGCGRDQRIGFAVNVRTLRLADRFSKEAQVGKAIIVEISDSETGSEVLAKLAKAGIINMVSGIGSSFVARYEVNTSSLRKAEMQSRAVKSEQ